MFRVHSERERRVEYVVHSAGLRSNILYVCVYIKAMSVWQLATLLPTLR